MMTIVLGVGFIASMISATWWLVETGWREAAGEPQGWAPLIGPMSMGLMFLCSFLLGASV